LLNNPLRRSALRDNHVNSMRAIYDDPVRGPAYRAKISAPSKPLVTNALVPDGATL